MSAQQPATTSTTELNPYAVLTLIPVPETSSPLAILAVGALGMVSLLKHKSKNS